MFSVLIPRDSMALSSWSLEPGTLHLPLQINSEICLMDICSQILYKNAFISLHEKLLQSSSKFSVSGKGRIKGDTWGEVGAQTTPLRAWSHTQLPHSHFSEPSRQQAPGLFGQLFPYTTKTCNLLAALNSHFPKSAGLSFSCSRTLTAAQQLSVPQPSVKTAT